MLSLASLTSNARNIIVAVWTAILYYYISVMHLEVKHIWPQRVWKLGKILYYTARGSVILSVVTQMLIEIPIHRDLGVKVWDMIDFCA